MSFRGHVRPGQGFKPFQVMRRTAGVTAKGRPYSSALTLSGTIFGIISQATPQEVEQFRQLGSPITHTIVQRGKVNAARSNDVLRINGADPRYFLVQGDPQDPGELGHFLVYHVQERKDLEGI